MSVPWQESTCCLFCCLTITILFHLIRTQSFMENKSVVKGHNLNDFINVFVCRAHSKRQPFWVQLGFKWRSSDLKQKLCLKIFFKLTFFQMPAFSCCQTIWMVRTRTLPLFKFNELKKPVGLQVLVQVPVHLRRDYPNPKPEPWNHPLGEFSWRETTV